LTIRAEVLPDDTEWHAGKMPTLVHTMPLSSEWNGRPDPFGGVAYGMQIETSHVTIQGLKILGMPVVEHPKSGAIHRVYPIGRNDRKLDLDDLLREERLDDVPALTAGIGPLIGADQARFEQQVLDLVQGPNHQAALT
jgi:hypothetical protein